MARAWWIVPVAANPGGSVGRVLRITEVPVLPHRLVVGDAPAGVVH